MDLVCAVKYGFEAAAAEKARIAAARVEANRLHDIREEEHRAETALPILIAQNNDG